MTTDRLLELQDRIAKLKAGAIVATSAAREVVRSSARLVTEAQEVVKSGPDAGDVHVPSADMAKPGKKKKPKLGPGLEATLAAMMKAHNAKIDATHHLDASVLAAVYERGAETPGPATMSDGARGMARVSSFLKAHRTGKLDLFQDADLIAATE